jgi:hypothetical protein
LLIPVHDTRFFQFVQDFLVSPSPFVSPCRLLSHPLIIHCCHSRPLLHCYSYPSFCAMSMLQYMPCVVFFAFVFIPVDWATFRILFVAASSDQVGIISYPFSKCYVLRY